MSRNLFKSFLNYKGPHKQTADAMTNEQAYDKTKDGKLWVKIKNQTVEVEV